MEMITEHWTTLIGPAVIAAVISSIVTVIGFFITTRAAKAMHREKLDFDRELAKCKVAADIALTEKKLALDRALADLKRRTELAEQVLADFYKARDLFEAAQSIYAFAGEGGSRTRDTNETPGETQSRNGLYAPDERLSKHIDFFSELHARRYRFMALFGIDAGKPFGSLLQAHNQIALATSALLDPRRKLRDEVREKYESQIWNYVENDPIKQIVTQAVIDIETICRPVLETKAV